MDEVCDRFFIWQTFNKTIISVQRNTRMDQDKSIHTIYLSLRIYKYGTNKKQTKDGKVNISASFTLYNRSK